MPLKQATQTLREASGCPGWSSAVTVIFTRVGC